MPSTQKVADIVIIGSGRFFENIKTICSHQKNKNVFYANTTNYHFISESMIVVDGQKISAKKFLIHAPENTLKKTGVNQVSALYLTSDKLSTQDLFDNPLPNTQKTIVTESTKLLPEFDSSVQKVITSMCKKLGIQTHTSVVFHSMSLENGMMHVICSKQAKPLYFTAGTVTLSEHHAQREIFGGVNITGIRFPKGYSLFSATHHIAIAKDLSGMTLADEYAVADFLTAKTRTIMIKDDFHVVSNSQLTYFSIGMNEQDFALQPVAYKKALVKLSSPDSNASWFMKIITSQNGRLVGIHGALPFAYSRLDFFRKLVSGHMNVKEIAHIPQDDALTSVCLELIGELT